MHCTKEQHLRIVKKVKLPDPMTPLTPMSSLAKNTPIITVASSGALEPAAINLK